jgi:NAD(P) transhydrogenase subunit alpha
MMLTFVADSDVVITTAAVPGKRAPILVTAEMVEGMAPGSVVVDLAAERGGNCELTRPGETVAHKGVTILGPLNLPATVPHHARLADEITAGTLVTRDGKVVNPMVLETMGTATEGGVSR